MSIRLWPDTLFIQTIHVISELRMVGVASVV
jgi:hypothetical protein